MAEILAAPFEEEFLVQDYACDFRNKLKPGSLLRLTQQVGTDQCLALGMDDAFYQKHHAVFLMAKQALQVRRTPCKGERLTLRTLPQAPRHAIYKRVTQLLDQAGEQVALVDSRWALVDVDTRRVLRQEPPGFPQPWLPEVEQALDQRLQKPGAEALEPPQQRLATYTLCDQNGHINNAAYADLVCDALPVDALRQTELAELHIQYHWEIPLGEHFLLRRADLGQGGWYFCGEREGRKSFEAQALLRPLTTPEQTKNDTETKVG